MYKIIGGRGVVPMISMYAPIYVYMFALLTCAYKYV